MLVSIFKFIQRHSDDCHLLMYQDRLATWTHKTLAGLKENITSPECTARDWLLQLHEAVPHFRHGFLCCRTKSFIELSLPDTNYFQTTLTFTCLEIPRLLTHTSNKVE